MIGAAHHDSAAFLAVEYFTVLPKGRSGGHGWYVRRICGCHPGDIVSMCFATRAEAERCRRVLDADAQRYGDSHKRAAGGRD